MPSRTPIRKAIAKGIEALNDQLQFFLLTEFELLDRLANFTPAIESAFTSDVFARNPYAPRIHVRLKEMKRHQTANRQFTFGAYFSTAFEVASTFFSRATDLLKETNRVTINAPRIRNEGPESHYHRSLSMSGFSAPPDEIRDTFTYCRYRRNGIIHLAKAASPSFASFISAQGSALNAYWGSTRGAVDFSVPAVSWLSESDVLTLIKLLRISVIELDEHLASIVQAAGAVTYSAQSEFGQESVRMNADVARQRVKRLRATVKRDFGFEPSGAELEEVVRIVGVR